MKTTLICSVCKKDRDVLTDRVCNPCRNFQAFFDQLIRDDLIEWLLKAGDKLYAKMTDEEIKSMQVNGALVSAGYRLQKIILCALADGIENQFAAESTMKDIRKLKRIDRERQ